MITNMRILPIQTDHKAISKPWGYYISLALTHSFQTKIIVVNPGGQLSLQSHQHREEHWIVISGSGLVQVDETISAVGRGS